jgi:anion-transporting  ArsA/GET3 family ATPase
MSPIPEPTCTQLDTVLLRLDTLDANVGEMRDVLKTLATAITKLALVEAAQDHAKEASDRAFRTLEHQELRQDGIDTRLDALERAAPLQALASKWLLGAVWGTLGFLVTAFALYTLKHLGLT